MSFTVNRVRWGGGGVPRTRGPMYSIFSPTEMSAGIRSVQQIRVETPPDLEIRLLAAAASMRTFAVRFAPCPVTTRRIGGCPPVSFVIALDFGPRIRLLRLFDASQGRGSFAHDDHPGFLVLGPLPADLLGEVPDDRTGRRGDRRAGGD